MTEGTTGPARKGGRRALGRGLDALLPAAAAPGLRDVEISRIEPNPEQPRRRFDQSALQDLAASIAQHGIVQPIVVADIGDDRYRIIVGERRFRAAQLSGLERVPVLVKEASDRQTLELALIENLQRMDLNPLEEAQAFSRLIQDFGLTQAEVGRQVGRSRTAVANTIRLLLLPETIKRAIVEERITEGHARALLALPDQQAQLAVLEKIERDDLTVRATEDLVRRLLERPAPRPARRKDPDLDRLEDDLRRALGTKVSVRPGKQGGRIVIEYYSDEEFEGLYGRLTGER